MTKLELEFVAGKSRIWTGPNAWAWIAGYRLDLRAALELPGFG